MQSGGDAFREGLVRIMERKKIYDSTKLIRIEDDAAIKEAGERVRNGEVVGFPTETVYGLGANALDEASVNKIYEAKGRPGDNPLIVHIADKSQIAELVSEVTPMAQKLIDAFMPGPITVIMPKSSVIPSNVTAGLNTVGIRMPASMAANKFLKACACPVAAPSANLSGSPSPTKASHVMADMDGYVYAVIDGGDSDFGLESTVVDATGEEPVVLRPGAITKAQIDEVLSSNASSRSKAEEGETPAAPGMKYRHYAPKAEVILCPISDTLELLNDHDNTCADSEIEDAKSEANEPSEPSELSEEERRKLFEIAKPFIFKAKELLSQNPLMRIGVFAGVEVKGLFDLLGDEVLVSHLHFYTYGKTLDVKAASHFLFDGLRCLDLQGVSAILAPSFAGDGLSVAYMNRIGKAATNDGEAPNNASKSEEDLSSSTTTKLSATDCDEVITAQVLFVCDSGRSMSLISEVIMKKLLSEKAPYQMADTHTYDGVIGAELYVESAGIYASDGDKPDQNTLAAIKKVLGIDASYYLATRTCASIYDESDLILTMRDSQASEILSAFPDLSGRVFSFSSYLARKGIVMKDDKGNVISLSIPSPEGETIATHIHVVKALAAWIELMFPYILADLQAERM